MGVTVKTDMSGVEKKIKLMLGNRKVGMFVASTFERGMNKYVPMDTGMLAQNVVSQPFEVHYNQTYAEKIYNGTHIKFNKEKHPLATAEWDKAFYNANKESIARQISAYLEKGNY